MNINEKTLSALSGSPGGFASWRFVLKLSLYFLVIALPLAFYLRTFDSVTIKITVLQLALLLSIAVLAYGALEEGRLELPSGILPFFVPAFLLLLWNALRFPFSPYPAASLEWFLRQEALLLTFIFTLLAFSWRDLRRAVIVILGGWFIAALFGLAQRFGLDPFIWKGAYGERIFSTLGNPELFAAYQALCLPLLPVVAVDAKLALLPRVLAAGAAVLGSFTLAWTFAPLEIGVFAAATAVFLLAVPRVLSGRRRNIALAVSVFCVAVCLAVSARSMARSGALPREVTFILETWKGTWELIKTSPWLGSGPGSFRPLYPAFRRPEAILVEHAHNSETTHSQNELLEQWTGGGLPAVVLWLWLFGAVFYKGWKTLSSLPQGSEKGGYLAGIYASLAGGMLVLMGLTAARFTANAWLIFFLAGLVCAARRTALEETEPVFALPLPFYPLHRGLYALLLPAVLLPAWGAVRMFGSDMHHNKAIFWSKKGDWAKAVGEYDREVWGAPGYIMGQYFKGNVYKYSNGPGDLERALEQYRYVRSLSPDYAEVHAQEAIVLIKLGRKNEAIKSLETQARLDPVWDFPWHTLAELYRETAQPEKAAEAARKTLEARNAWEKAAPRPRKNI